MAVRLIWVSDLKRSQDPCFADVKSGDDLTFSSIFEEKMSVTLQVYREGIRSSVHSLL
jgi:hypothetical protein